MHTTVWATQDIEVRFHHNGDYSGNAIIAVKDLRHLELKARETVVPIDALVHLVASMVRDAKIGELEWAKDKELLGL